MQENSRKCNTIFYIFLLLHHQGAKGTEGVKGADGVKGDMGRRGLKGPKGLKGPGGRKVQYSLVQKATLCMQHIKTHLHFRKKEQVINSLIIDLIIRHTENCLYYKLRQTLEDQRMYKQQHTGNAKEMLERMPLKNFLTIIIIVPSQSIIIDCNYYSILHLDGLASQTVL